MPLPDIPNDLWVADQQQQFRKITDPLFPAFEFEQAAKDIPIPHDYPLEGGPDQWDQARQQEIERQLREQQQQEEEAQRQRQAEIEQQLRDQQQAQEQAATQVATDNGITTPDTALSTFQQAAQQGPSQDNTSTVAFGQPTAQPEQSPADQFLAHSGGMNDQFFGPPQPTDSSEPPPDNTSSAAFNSTAQATTGTTHSLIDSLVPPEPGTKVPIQNDDGSITTERSITVTEPDLNDGRPTNIPSVWGGRVVSDDVAVANAIRSGRQWDSFNSLDDAEQAAVQRSADLGAGKERSIGSTSLPYDSRAQDEGAHELPPDNTSTNLPPQEPGFLERANTNLHILGGQVSDFLNEHSLPRAIRDTAEQQALEQEARAGVDPTDVAGLVLPHQPAEEAWRAQNPEKAARLDELRQGEEALAAGASGTMGGGGMAEDAVAAIKALRAAGLDEAAAQAMREMAQKSSLTLGEIEARVLGRKPPTPAPAEDALPNEVPNPFPLTDEERALNAAADEKARTQPAHGGYLEDPTFGVDEPPTDVISGAPKPVENPVKPSENTVKPPENTVKPPEIQEPTELPVSAQSVAREYQPALPGMESVAASEEHIPGQGNVGELSPEARNRQASERASYEANDPAAQPITFEETAAQAEGVNTPEVRARVLDEAPGTRAAEQTALRTEAAGVNEAWAQAQRDLEAFKREHGDDPSNWNRDVQEEGAHLVTRLDALDREVHPSNTAASRMATETARAFTSLRSAISGSRAADQVRRMQAMYDDLKAAGAALQEAAKTGVLSPDKRQLIERARDRLKNPKERVIGPGEAAENELDSIAEAARKARGPRKPATAGEGAGGAGRNPPVQPGAVGDAAEESFAEKLGRLKREQGRLEDTNGPPAELERVRGEIDDTLSQIRMDAEERAKAWMRRERKPNLNDLPEAERERIINEAAGRSTVQRIRSAARAEISGTAAAKEQEQLTRGFEQAIQKQLNNEAKLRSSIDAAVQNRIDRALLREKNAQVRAEVKNMTGDARDIQQAIRARPNDMDLRTWMDLHLRNMAEHSNAGEEAARILRESFEKQYGQDAKRFMGQVEGRNAAADAKKLRDFQKQVENQKLSSLADQMDFVLKHAQAPGAADRYAELAADMTAVSARGAERASQLREQLWRHNLTQAGQKLGAADLRPIVQAIQNMNPNDPESIRAALGTLRNPTWGGAYHELQFIHMLSDPRTHLRNIQGNAMNAALKLFIQNPVEAITGGAMGAKNTGGVGTAISGFGRGFKEGLPTAATIMRHGVNPEMVEHAIESGNIARLGREQITEKLGQRFGKPGELFGTALHMISTRPLESMDALLGHAMYASKLDQEIERTANQLFHDKLPEYAGMDKAAIKEEIQRNPWKFPQLIDQAEYAKEYMLMRAKDKNKWEVGLRNFMSNRTGGGLGGWALDFMLPFFNVPLNYAKQGVQRSLGTPYYAGQGVIRAIQGHPREAAESFGKSAVGASILGTGIMLALSDNLTGDGPTQNRDVWLLDHQPRSMRIPGTKNWLSWENTPMGIPWGAIAGAREAYQEAQLQGGKKGLTPENMAGQIAMKSAGGAVQGLLGNTFLEGVKQNFDALTLQGLGPSQFSVAAANAAARYNPVPLPMGTLGFLSRVADQMDRDVGRLQSWAPEDFKNDVQKRLEARLPGLRNTLPERLNAFGEPVANTTGGNIIRAALPTHYSQGQGGGDPNVERKAQVLEGVGVGMPDAPQALTIGGYSIPLTPEEQRQYQQTWGRGYSTLLDQFKARYPDRQFPDDAYTKLRDYAREQAQAQIARQLGTEELKRRAREQRARVVEPVR